MTRLNPALKQMAISAILAAQQREKVGFVGAGDPSMGGAPAGGDPAAAGGGDPMAAGGGAPAGGGDPMAALQPMIQQAVQQAVMSSGGGGGGGEGGGIKPKIDVNVTLLQILKLLARIADALQIPIPASEMVATSGDLTQMAAQQQNPTAAPPAAGGGGGLGQISPVEPMKAAAWENGTPFTGVVDQPMTPRTPISVASQARALLVRQRLRDGAV